MRLGLKSWFQLCKFEVILPESMKSFWDYTQKPLIRICQWAGGCGTWKSMVGAAVFLSGWEFWHLACLIFSAEFSDSARLWTEISNILYYESWNLRGFRKENQTKSDQVKPNLTQFNFRRLKQSIIWNAGWHQQRNEGMLSEKSADERSRARKKVNNLMHTFIKPELAKDLK